MDSLANLFIKRAENEIVIAEKLREMSENEEARDFLQIPQDMIFYSAVISHAYYAIFYSAKAVLLAKGIKTTAPDIHKKTFDAFKEHFVDTGVLDLKLLEIYRRMVVRADDLLEIFRDEKWKRGNFTYNTIPQANREAAEDSIQNAKTFVSNINKVAKEM